MSTVASSIPRYVQTEGQVTTMQDSESRKWVGSGVGRGGGWGGGGLWKIEGKQKWVDQRKVGCEDFIKVLKTL